MKKLEEKLGYRFKNKKLMLEALTHSSYANENRSANGKHYERLEFLGDSILGFVTATYLYQMEPNMPEGKMTRLRAELVCEQSLYGVALDLGLGDFIRMGHGEEKSGGRQRVSILADVVEAVIAAMYLDGGIEETEKFIRRTVLSPESIEAHHAADYKSELQEYIQQRSDLALEYVKTGETGPDHDKIFSVNASINGEVVGSGTGRSKKEAEQAAAREALLTLIR